MAELNDLIEECSRSGMFETIDYNQYNDLLMIHSSSVMEGSTLTLHETEMLITENITPDGKPLEHSLMIKDHYNALVLVNEFAKHNPMRITNQMVKEIASSVMHSTGEPVNTPLGTYDKGKGDYRLNNVRSTGGHYYINFDKVQSRMDKLLDTVNETLQKITTFENIFTVASYLHLEFLTIHPFGDGNGRTARLLNNLILINKRLPILIIEAHKKGKYIEAIKQSREKEDMEIFNKFLQQEYIKYWRNELTLFKSKSQGKGMDFSFTLIL